MERASEYAKHGCVSHTEEEKTIERCRWDEFINDTDVRRRTTTISSGCFYFSICSLFEFAFSFLICSFSFFRLFSCFYCMQKSKCNKVSSIVNVTITTKMQQNAWLRWCLNCLLLVYSAETDRTTMAHEHTAIGRCVAVLWCRELSHCHPNGIWSSEQTFCRFSIVRLFVYSVVFFRIHLAFLFEWNCHLLHVFRNQFELDLITKRKFHFAHDHFVYYFMFLLLCKHSKICWILSKLVNTIEATSKIFFIQFYSFLFSCIHISICGLHFQWIRIFIFLFNINKESLISQSIIFGTSTTHFILTNEFESNTEWTNEGKWKQSIRFVYFLTKCDCQTAIAIIGCGFCVKFTRNMKITVRIIIKMFSKMCFGCESSWHRIFYVNSKRAAVIVAVGWLFWRISN